MCGTEQTAVFIPAVNDVPGYTALTTVCRRPCDMEAAQGESQSDREAAQ